MTGGKGHPGYLALLDEIRDLHLLKSGGYGSGADPFWNFTAVAEASRRPRFVYPLERDFEKSIRSFSLYQQGREGELGEEFLDKASLMLCAAAMLREDNEGGTQ